ncbi:DUF1801 domain-containing protein [Candidatus Peregrinibacteria bacterium]|nr:DUF1801 domain-containing protein [Candidatus Peregrinibacteria bacterium]
MQSKAKTVTEYLKEVPSDRLDTLLEIRDLCLQNLNGFQESMQYGMPTYSRNNVAAFSWNSQKNYMSLYVSCDPKLVDPFKPRLKKADIGKSCIRFRKPEDIDFDTVRDILISIKSS